MSVHAVPDPPDQQGTETATVEALGRSGYDVDYEIRDGRLLADGVTVDPGGLVVDRTYRFEGPSDPEYQSLVLALRDPATAARGVLVTAYGPTASATEAEVLRGLVDDPHQSF